MDRFLRYQCTAAFGPDPHRRRRKMAGGTETIMKTSKYAIFAFVTWVVLWLGCGRLEPTDVVSRLASDELPAAACTYFVKNGGSDGAEGQSDASAWATLSKVSNASFVAGDIICLKRGSEWREQLNIPSNDLTLDAYGTGPAPIINGADLVTGGWTQDSGDVYYASVSGTVWQVFQDDSWVHLAHEPDHGYFTADVSKDTRWEIGETGNDMPYSDAQLSGAELLIRPELWFRLAYRVQSYDDDQDTIHLEQDERSDRYDGTWNDSQWFWPNRYWLTNKRLFLDSANEWFHDVSAERLYVFQAAGGSPTGDWQVMRRLHGIYAQQKHRLTIRNIEIKHAANAAIFLDDCLDFDIDSVEAHHCGTQRYYPGTYDTYHSLGIRLDGQSRPHSETAEETGVIQNCAVHDIMTRGILARNYHNVTVRDCAFENIGMVGVADGFGPRQSFAIQWLFDYESRNWLVENNTIVNTGYSGINAARDAIIRNNTFVNTLMDLGDGGAIYAGGNARVTITGNLIDTTGADPQNNTRCGIYLDVSNSDNVVTDNVISNTGYCLFNHGGSNNHYHNNICCDYRRTCASFKLRSAGPHADLESLEFIGNSCTTTFADTLWSQVSLKSSIAGVDPSGSWFDGFDGNSYFPDGAGLFQEQVTPDPARRWDFTGWQAASGLDPGSSVLSQHSCDRGVELDAGPADVSVDAGLDAGTDATTDAATDTGVNTPADGGVDAAVDAGADAGLTVDARAVRDMGMDSGAASDAVAHEDAAAGADVVGLQPGMVNACGCTAHSTRQLELLLLPAICCGLARRARTRLGGAPRR